MKKMSCFFAFFWLVSLTVSAQAEVVRLHGATTVVDRVIKPHKAAVEAKTGLSLEVVGNATGKGLVDLAEGRCDASLSSEPPGIALQAAKVAGKELDIKAINFTVVKLDEIVFVVNPANKVNKLDWAQIKAIHTGKFTNWKEVGGKDAPINVYTDTPTGGTRALIKNIVMGDAEYSDKVRPQSTVKQVGEMVAADPHGFGGLGKGFVNEKIKIVETKKVDRPLGFITLGEPKGNVKKVIEAFRVEVGKAGK